MSKHLCILCLLLFSLASGYAINDQYTVYPPLVQKIERTMLFQGDYHKEFEGDFVAILSNGSAWKVHPDDSSLYKQWKRNDLITPYHRAEWYFRKREHHFELHNLSNGNRVRTMLVRHSRPHLRIEKTKLFFKGPNPNFVEETLTEYDSNGKLKGRSVYERFYGGVSNKPRMLVVLSDGSRWVIRDQFNSIEVDTEVEVVARTTPLTRYDFSLVVGVEREARVLFARPHFESLSVDPQFDELP